MIRIFDPILDFSKETHPKNPKRLSQWRESEMYKEVEITCCLRAVLVLARNPTRKTKLKVRKFRRISPAGVRVFFRFLR